MGDKKLKVFMNNISFTNGKYRKKFSYSLVLTGMILGIFLTNWLSLQDIFFYFTAYCLGVPCVVSLGSRYPILGNVLGLLSNIGEIIINAMFGNFGLAIAGIYYGVTHIIGLDMWTKKKNKDEDGNIKVTTMNKFWVIFTIIFSIAGLVVLIKYGDKIGFVNQGGTVGNLLYWGNIIAYLLGIVSQFLMIMRIDFSWWGWFASNFFWFTLDLFSGNIWFAVRDVLYQINVVTAIWNWTNASKKSSK